MLTVFIIMFHEEDNKKKNMASYFKPMKICPKKTNEILLLTHGFKYN